MSGIPFSDKYSPSLGASEIIGFNVGACLNQLGSRYSRIPSRPPSRPYPLSRYPPKSAVPPFGISPKSSSRIEMIRAVHPNDALFHLGSDMKRDVDSLAPNAGC